MTVRTKSKAQQWVVWLYVSLVLLAVYVVLSKILYGSAGFDIFVPRQQRLLLPLLVLLVYVARATRWDGSRMEPRRGNRECEAEKAGGQPRSAFGPVVQPTDDNRVHTPGAPRSSGTADSLGDECESVGVGSLPQNDNETADIHCQPRALNSIASLSGEELFGQARAMAHRMVPDFQSDGQYLDLLGRSAQKGYAPAMAKLGEYAMRRAAWVEAYYWMKQAQRNGMHGISPTLREIRKNWSQDGFPDQSSNINQLFTSEAGSLGRALLHVDSGRKAANAKEFLRVNYPEFLV